MLALGGAPSPREIAFLAQCCKYEVTYKSEIAFLTQCLKYSGPMEYPPPRPSWDNANNGLLFSTQWPFVLSALSLLFLLHTLSLEGDFSRVSGNQMFHLIVIPAVSVPYFRVSYMFKRGRNWKNGIEWGADPTLKRHSDVYAVTEKNAYLGLFFDYFCPCKCLLLASGRIC